ncbi:peptidase M23 [Microbacterium caowuchunii]|uniref:Peptidase M23 n=1 Tax=Microbacterium caowuchunii TaxID=2614638 RepID=A0A5N0TCP2_9MICO|nr:peptidase M23 [Microbacterium caowuchunii]
MSAITLVLVIGVALLLGSAVRAFDDERTWDISDDTLTLPPAAAYDTEQLANAAIIMRAGRDLLLPPRDQAIAVMTAMGESSLRNIDYGDWETNGVTNPDGSPTSSIGLFQQQDWWGTREQRLDPYTAATLFYQRMIKIPAAEREALAPTEVAHRTQINADPDHYTRYWPAAVRIVEDLSGTDTGLAPNPDR